VAKQYAAAPEMKIDPNKTYTAVMHTTKGDITFTLLPKEAPMTVNNFVFLAGEGYYDGVVFHRIIKGFMVQSGDPTGTGAGGPGYKFKDEPVSRRYVRGTLAMANAGPNTNGSQFFIVHQDAGLPPAYTIFGYASAGLDVLDQIANVPTTSNPATGERNSKPTEEVKITGIDITEA
jgi:cyclophilin family peptidyl-prolyl cis-trans isomerase